MASIVAARDSSPPTARITAYNLASPIVNENLTGCGSPWPREADITQWELRAGRRESDALSDPRPRSATSRNRIRPRARERHLHLARRYLGPRDAQPNADRFRHPRARLARGR